MKAIDKSGAPLQRRAAMARAPAYLRALAALPPLLLLLGVVPTGAIKAAVHPAATECFTEYISQEHFVVGRRGAPPRMRRACAPAVPCAS